MGLDSTAFIFHRWRSYQGMPLCRDLPSSAPLPVPSFSSKQPTAAAAAAPDCTTHLLCLPVPLAPCVFV